MTAAVSAEQLRAALLPTAAPVTAFPTCVVCGGRLDAFLAAQGYDQHAMCGDNPPAVAPPPVAATFARPGGAAAPHPLKADLIAMIRWAEANSTRSQQVAVGPSEIGTVCDRRLAYRIAGTPAANTSADPWFAIIGTAVHEWIAHAIERYQYEALGRRDATRRYLIERRLTISTDPATGDVVGSCDLYDRDQARVIDHKIVGYESLKKYREGPGDQYRRQIHLYGYGWEQAGYPVRDVAIAFYPRSTYLDEMHVWSQPYDRQVALDALARLGRIRTAVTALQLPTQPALWPAIPAQPGPTCTWCPFWRPGTGPADGTGCPGTETR